MAKSEMDDLMSIESTTMYENSLLGLLIKDPLLIDEISGDLHVEDFMHTVSRAVYASLIEMNTNGDAIDMITVMGNLDSKEQLKPLGGPAAVVNVLANRGAKENLKSYVEIVKERSRARQLVAAGNAIIGLGRNPDNINESLALAQDALQKIESKTAGQDFYHVREILSGVTENIDNRITQGSGGLDMGFRDLDAKINGMQSGDLIIVAGRPSMGKTVFAMNIATHVSTNINSVTNTECSVAVFSLEMGKDQLVERSIAALGSIEYQKIKTGSLEDSDYDGLFVAVEKLSKCNMYISDMGGLTHQQLAAKARVLTRKLADTDAPLGLIVIDYLQLMGFATNSMSRNDQITEISRKLKLLGKELGVPIIALAQLNRTVEQRQDKRPVMSDLRESGAIEQDADIIIMLYRDEYYNPDSEHKGVAEALIRKQRNGSLGVVPLSFEGQFSRMTNLDRFYEAQSD